MDGLPYYEIIGEFDAKLPFEIEGWTNSVNLMEEMKQDNNFKNEIQKTYDVIKVLLKKKISILLLNS